MYAQREHALRPVVLSVSAVSRFLVSTRSINIQLYIITSIEFCLFTVFALRSFCYASRFPLRRFSQNAVSKITLSASRAAQRPISLRASWISEGLTQT